MYYWELIGEDGKVYAIKNPRGEGLLEAIQDKLKNGPVDQLWEDLECPAGCPNPENPSQTGPVHDCSAALNTDEIKGYIGDFPKLQASGLSQSGGNVYNKSNEDHRMLCNIAKVDDGARPIDIFQLTLVDGVAYYKKPCLEQFPNSNTGVELAPDKFPPAYMVMIVGLYDKYVSNANIDIPLNFDYLPKKASQYPGMFELDCVGLD
jgi:hypothetical protein